MELSFTILPLPFVAALLATAAIAYVLGRRMRNRLPAILIAGFALPVAMMLAALYGVAAEPDAPAPGMILIVALAVAAAVAPVTLIVSVLAVRHARR